jgi:hypothetical protein
MHDPNNNYKLWALKSIVDVAQQKISDLVQRKGSEQEIVQVMAIVSDANKKLLEIQWSNTDGLDYGVRLYSRAIENL